MSRIGRKPIVIPAGVEVKVDEADHAITVKGPKGTLHSKFHPLMTVKVEGNEILVTRPNDEKEASRAERQERTVVPNPLPTFGGFLSFYQILRSICPEYP